MFLNPNNFSQFELWLFYFFRYEKPPGTSLKSILLENFFLTVGQNNFNNKIPLFFGKINLLIFEIEFLGARVDGGNDTDSEEERGLLIATESDDEVCIHSV